METLLVVIAVAVVIFFWLFKRRLICKKKSSGSCSSAKPCQQKSESAPSVEAASQGDEAVDDRRHSGVADRRHHAVEEQQAEPAPVVAREEAPVEVVAQAPQAAEAPKVEPAPAPAAAVREELPADWQPEDSVLRRHYLANLQAEREALTNPYPTDSTLRRHYDAMVKITIDGPSIYAREENVPTQEESELLNSASGQSAMESVQEEIASERVSSSVPVYEELHAHAAAKTSIPEDSVLRRHFLANLQAEIEAELPVRPTDSTLKRHYDALVHAKMEERLDNL